MTPRFPVSAAVLQTAQIRQVEARALQQVEGPCLMERAGLAAAEIARNMTSGGGRVLVVAGPGNNGGDAFVVARHLKSWWYDVDLVFAGTTAKLPADASAACSEWQLAGGTIHKAIPGRKRWDLVIDGIFGIGLQREITGFHAGLITAINAQATPVLALDIPSGLASDTGRVQGCAVSASRTCTFIALKPGLLTAEGPDHCGEIDICALGLPPSLLAGARGSVAGKDVLENLLPRRRANSHKGHFGSVGVIGGAPGMPGAALLAGRAALMLGAGRVYVGMLGSDCTIDPIQPELMLRTASDVLGLEHLNCHAIGPGLGLSVNAGLVLEAAMARGVPLVLDADALNLLASNKTLRDGVRARSATTLLTPHPAEAARLLESSAANVQNDRIAAALEIATRFNAHVLLKGAGTVCASPGGRWSINSSGNPGMASAGMGDVLTGMLAALLAQNVEARAALIAGAYLHGAAADELVAQGAGPVGLTASELIPIARSLINRGVR